MEETTEKYIILKEDKSFENFIIQYKEIAAKYYNSNLIIDLDKFKLSINQIKKIQLLSNTHKQKGKSFVLVLSNINIDDVDDSLIIAPTMQEAEDIIAMEELERELGF